jgi:hypothetical protein
MSLGRSNSLVLMLGGWCAQLVFWQYETMLISGAQGILLVYDAADRGEEVEVARVGQLAQEAQRQSGPAVRQGQRGPMSFVGRRSRTWGKARRGERTAA